MKTRLLCIVLCLVTVFFLPATLMAGSRATAPNAVDLELLGKCLIYSFNYQRMLAEPFGLEGGVSLFGSDKESIFIFTAGAKVYFLQKDASPFVGLGYTGLTNATEKGPLKEGVNGYGYVCPGFEYRSEGGFLARAAVYGLITGNGVQVWPGVTIGIAF